jgi:hypothetical protein
MADYYYFLDLDRSKGEKQRDGSKKVWAWVAVTTDETGGNLPADVNWRRFEFRNEADKEREGKWITPRDVDSLTDEEKEKGCAVLGEFQGWKAPDAFEKLWIIEQPRKRIVWEGTDGKWMARRQMGYGIPHKLPAGVKDEEWTYWRDAELEHPLASWSDEIVGDIEREGVHKYKVQGEVGEILAKILMPEPPLRIYWFEDDSKRVEKESSRLEFTAWTNDPQGKNLPQGDWKLYTVLNVEKWHAYKYFEIDNVRRAIKERGYLVDWMEVPTVKVAASVESTEKSSGLQRSSNAVRDPGPSDSIKAVLDELFPRK